MKHQGRINLSKSKVLFTDIYFLFTLIVCVALVLFKYSDFTLPYFSDELWVYGPSVRKMGIHGPSMLPSSLKLEDHWAHPLLFFFTGGLWCLIFGSSILSTHIFAACISITLLISVYFVGKNLFNKKIGFYTVLIFSSQSIFLGQFSLVLPEVMLTLFTLLTIYYYYKEKYLWYIVSGACLVLVKETGIFPILAIVLWNIIKDVIYENQNFFKWSILKKYLILIFPFLILGIHFLTLKIIYGWFLMPDRVHSFEFSWDIYHERIMHSIHYVFIGQGRKIILISLSVIAVLFNKRYPLWVRIFLFLLGFSIIKIFFKYWKLPEIFSMLMIPAVFSILLKIIFWDIYKTDKKKGEILGIFSIFILIYLLFSSSQFDSLRYLLCLIPLFIMMTVYFIDNISWGKKILLPVISVIFIGFSLNYLLTDKNWGDDTNNYKNVCIIRKQSIQFLEKNNYYSSAIKAPFLYSHAIRRPLTGYLQSERIFSNVSSIDGKTKNCEECICIFENTDPSLYYEEISQNNNFELINKSQKGSVWIEIYKKK